MGDFYDDRWRSRDHNDDRPRKRFDKYRVIGMLLLFFGIAILALGIFDVGWTVSRYGDNCQVDNTAYPNLCTGNHVFVYVGSPLWGGALLICAAFLALSVHPDKAHHRSAHRNFIYFLALHMIVVQPATVVLNVLEVVFGKNIFWMYNSSGQMQIYDNLQVGLPIAIAILAGMAINAILFFLVFVFCCSEDKGRRSYKGPRYYDGPEVEDSYRGQGHRYPPRDPYRYTPRGGNPGYGGGYGGRRNYYN